MKENVSKVEEEIFEMCEVDDRDPYRVMSPKVVDVEVLSTIAKVGNQDINHLTDDEIVFKVSSSEEK